MSNDFYSPPQAMLDRKNAERGEPVKAVIIATTIDICGTILLNMLLGFILTIGFLPQGISQEESVKMLYGYYKMPLIWGGLCLAGCLMSGFSGFVCAKIGKCTNYTLVSIYILTTLIIANLLIQDESDSLLLKIIPTLISILSAFAGGWIYMRKRPDK